MVPGWGRGVLPLMPFVYPQREHQPFSLQCEAVYEALKMPYRILPQQLPRKELLVGPGPEAWAKEDRAQSAGPGTGTGA